MAKTSPENGFFYRTVDQTEIDILLNDPTSYGLPAPTIGCRGPTYKELSRIRKMKPFKCQKFLSKRSDTVMYQADRAMLLVVDETLLLQDDWDIDPITLDAAIKGSAVVRAGVLIGFDDPLPTRPITPSCQLAVDPGAD